MTTLPFNALSLLLVAQEAAEAPNPWSGFWMMGIIILIFYFLIIAPQRREAKEKDAMRDGLKAGDEVVTIGGMHGQVTSVSKNSVVIKVGGKLDITFEKGAVARVVKKAE